MHNPFRKHTAITKQLVPRNQWPAVMERRTGLEFRLDLIARGFVITMTSNYHRHPWQLFELSDGCCYTAPQTTQVYHLIGEKRPLSADGIGLMCSMLSFNYLSFSMDLSFAERCSLAESHLHKFIHGHPEQPAILGTIDWGPSPQYRR